MSEAFTTGDVVEALGWEALWEGPRRLMQLIDQDVILPEVHWGHGSGDHHLWSLMDLVILRAVTDVWPMETGQKTTNGVATLRRLAADAVRANPHRRYLVMVPADGVAATTNDLASHLEASGERAKVTTIVDLDKVRQRLGMAA